jgi:hypothetical protein
MVFAKLSIIILQPIFLIFCEEFFTDSLCAHHHLAHHLCTHFPVFAHTIKDGMPSDGVSKDGSPDRMDQWIVFQGNGL